MDVSKSKALEALRLRVLGALHALIGEFETGRDMLRQAIELETELGRRSLSASAAGHFLGPLEHWAGNYGEAETILLKAYEDMSATGDQAFSATVAGNLGALYVDMVRFDDAERYARIALETSTPDDVAAQSTGRWLMARVLAQRGDQQSAEAMAREAVEIAENTDYLTLRGEAFVNLAEVLLAAGKTAEATDALRRALENYEAKGATAISDGVRKRLAEIAD